MVLSYLHTTKNVRLGVKCTSILCGKKLISVDLKASNSSYAQCIMLDMLEGYLMDKSLDSLGPATKLLLL